MTFSNAACAYCKFVTGLQAFFGFVPGVILSLGLYKVVSAATFLPVAMTGTRAVLVLAGTVLMCMLSGAIATRRLANADPADLF